MDERISVVAAYIKKDGRVLLTKRPLHKPRGGLWEFPGGKLEPGENPENALIREIKEELGIEIKVGEFLAEIDHDYPEIKIRLMCYVADIVKGEPCSLEGQKIAWVLPEDILDLKLAEADQKLWQKLKQL